MAHISVQLFGAFRDFNESNLLNIEYQDGMTVTDLKSALRHAFDGQEPFTSLLDRSRIADEKHIFSEGEDLTGAGDYAVLPPVNGG